MGSAQARNDFLLAEALYICRDGETIELCEEDGYMTFAQTEVLTALVKSEDRHALFESEEYITFRSWLKGGRVIAERIQKTRERKEKKRLAKLRKELLKNEERQLRRQKKEEARELRLRLERYCFSPYA